MAKRNRTTGNTRNSRNGAETRGHGDKYHHGVRLRSALALMIAIAVVAGGVLGFNLAPRRPLLQSVQVVNPPAGAASVAGSWPTSSTTPPNPGHATSFEVADAIVPLVQLYSSPGVPMPDDQADVPKVNEAVMHNPTWEGLSVLFLVKGHKGPDWLDVEVSARPNGLRAWIKASDVTIRTVPNWIHIEIGAKKAELMHGDTVLYSAPVVTGRDAAPTPTGVYFVDGIVHLSDPTGPYGIAQMSVSAFSGTYATFGAGVGQIAMHGTNAPGLVGQAVSHGCVRLTNDDISVFLMQAPTGTPVQIDP